VVNCSGAGSTALVLVGAQDTCDDGGTDADHRAGDRVVTVLAGYARKKHEHERDEKEHQSHTQHHNPSSLGLDYPNN